MERGPEYRNALASASFECDQARAWWDKRGGSRPDYLSVTALSCPPDAARRITIGTDLYDGVPLRSS